MFNHRVFLSWVSQKHTRTRQTSSVLCHPAESTWEHTHCTCLCLFFSHVISIRDQPGRDHTAEYSRVSMTPHHSKSDYGCWHRWWFWWWRCLSRLLWQDTVSSPNLQSWYWWLPAELDGETFIIEIINGRLWSFRTGTHYLIYKAAKPQLQKLFFRSWNGVTVKMGECVIVISNVDAYRMFWDIFHHWFCWAFFCTILESMAGLLVIFWWENQKARLLRSKYSLYS